MAQSEEIWQAALSPRSIRLVLLAVSAVTLVGTSKEGGVVTLPTKDEKNEFSL
jgi:hypothetical protein